MAKTATVSRVYPRPIDRTAHRHSEVLMRLMDHDPATSRVADVLLRHGHVENEHVELVGHVVPFLFWAARLHDEHRQVVCGILADFVNNDEGREAIAEADDGKDASY